MGESYDELADYAKPLMTLEECEIVVCGGSLVEMPTPAPTCGPRMKDPVKKVREIEKILMKMHEQVTEMHTECLARIPEREELAAENEKKWQEIENMKEAKREKEGKLAAVTNTEIDLIKCAHSERLHY